MQSRLEGAALALAGVFLWGWWRLHDSIEDEEETCDGCSEPMSGHEPENIRYSCAQCDACIHPDYCWSMESDGSEHEWVYIAYHCPCQTSDSYVFARYGFDPSACSYLAKYDASLVRGLVSGGWVYENPHRLRYVTPADPPLAEFRDNLVHVKTPADLQRIWNLNIPR